MARTKKPSQQKDSSADYLRLPGLFRRFELAEVLEAGGFFHLEEAGATTDGTPLFMLYRRRESRRAA